MSSSILAHACDPTKPISSAALNHAVNFGEKREYAVSKCESEKCQRTRPKWAAELDVRLTHKDVIGCTLRCSSLHGAQVKRRGKRKTHNRDRAQGHAISSSINAT